MQLKLVSRYSVGNGTKPEIEKFNEFMDLEFARFDHENWIEREYTHIHCIGKFIDIEYPTFKHP